MRLLPARTQEARRPMLRGLEGRLCMLNAPLRVGHSLGNAPAPVAESLQEGRPLL